MTICSHLIVLLKRHNGQDLIMLPPLIREDRRERVREVSDNMLIRHDNT